MRLREADEIQTGTLEHIQPRLADEWPAGLAPSVRNAISNIGIDRLYQHQADAIRKSLNGADVVLGITHRQRKNISIHHTDARCFSPQ